MEIKVDYRLVILRFLLVKWVLIKTILPSPPKAGDLHDLSIIAKSILIVNSLKRCPG